MLGFTLLISLVTGMLFGLVPALQATRPHLAGTLKDQAAPWSAARRSACAKALVVAQVTLSLLLLIGAGLFIESLKKSEGSTPASRPATC